MKADQVEISWDAAKGKWMVRIAVGAEVIRRHCDHPRDASEQTLRDAAATTATDEGYEADPDGIVINR